MMSKILIAALFTVSVLGATTAEAFVRAVESIGMTVSDLDRSVDFYEKVLSFEKISETEVDGPALEHLEGVFGVRMRVARMRLGDEILQLTEFLAPKGRPIPPDFRSNDRSFQHVAIIVSDMDRVYQWLRQNRIQHASSGPQRLPDWNKNAGGIEAFYFRDPDGHTLEILHFPPDKGNAKWHRNTGRLFLGIDHTAIVVSDTEATLNFYRETLGMRVAGEGENYGTEQEHLNNVFGARLRITALRAEAGPGIELLEYLAPADGRPYPADEKSNDAIHWQTRVVAQQAEDLAEVLVHRKTPFVSSGVVELEVPGTSFHKAFMVRDPDGHAVEIVKP